MRKLDLQKSIETFAVFDAALLALAVLGLLLALVGYIFSLVWLILAMALCELILFYAVFIEPRLISISTFRESLGAKPDAWIKLVFISDLHAGSVKPKKWYDALSHKLSQINPDLLLMAGDMVVHDAKEVTRLESLKKITTIYGSYFIMGNHDYQDDPAQIASDLADLGMRCIANTSLTLRIQGKELRITGLDDSFYGLVKLPVNRGPDKIPHIVLAHEPDALADLIEGQTDLVLCGHAHGGQIRFPFLGSLHVPSSLGRKADMGRKIIKGIPTIITRGLGEVGIRARLLAPPEIVVIELGI